MFERTDMTGAERRETADAEARAVSTETDETKAETMAALVAVGLEGGKYGFE
jgi:hypothetical protein